LGFYANRNLCTRCHSLSVSFTKLTPNVFPSIQQTSHKGTVKDGPRRLKDGMSRKQTFFPDLIVHCRESRYICSVTRQWTYNCRPTALIGGTYHQSHDLLRIRLEWVGPAQLHEAQRPPASHCRACIGTQSAASPETMWKTPYVRSSTCLLWRSRVLKRSEVGCGGAPEVERDNGVRRDARSERILLPYECLIVQ
jgi:hypothetical protein